jgi:superfamily I DNA/RNA helicase
MTTRGRKLILGPPGTGKTEACSEIILRELAAGIEPSRIALVTFAKAAAWEAKLRADAACSVDGQFLWFRTIHSMAFRLAGLEP